MTVPIRVLFQTEGVEKYARDVLGRFSNFEPIMRGPVRRLVRKAIVAQFRTRGRFGGTPWKPLAQITREYKAAHSGWRQEPLRRTDVLYRSLVYREGAEEIISREGYTLRTLVYYGKYHQSSEPRKSNLPRRPFIPEHLPDDYMAQLRNMVRGYIVSGEIAE